MSTAGKSADLTPRTGMDLRATDKGAGTSFVLNTIPRNGDLWTRPGFGLEREYGTSLCAGRVLSSGLNEVAADYGLGACIGATRVRTAWGADQILAIHPLLAFTGNLYSDGNLQFVPLYGRRATILAGVVAIVHDLHTNRFFEFVLHQQDANGGREADLSVVYPNYATRFDVDHSRWAVPTVTPTWAIFSPIATGVAFGTKAFNVVVTIDGMGQWTYRPVDCPRHWRRMNDSLDRTVLGPFMGEQGAFSPLGLAEGLLSAVDGAVYLETSDLGTVTSQCVYNDDIMVYAAGNTLWFSDPHTPQAILADSRYVVPSPDPITCVAPFRSSLLVATSGGKCWAYQPALGRDFQGTLASGTLTSISMTNGCVNNRAWCLGNDGVYFVDESGVYAWAGGLTLTWLSKPIDRLWSDPQSLQLPLTDFYQHGGITALAATQLPARMDIREQMRTARLTWDDARKTLLCTCDDVTLCWTAEFGWSVWLFQTHAGSGSEVRGLANIKAPIMVPVRDDLFLIGGPDQKTYQDNGNFDRVIDKSCYLLRMGRGGAIDRSTCMDVATKDVWTCVLGGYMVAGTALQITVGANVYPWVVVAGEDFATTYARLAAVVQTAIDPEYDFIAQPGALLAVAKVAGGGASAVATIASAGTFTAVHTQTGAVASIVDGDLEDQREPIGGWELYAFGPRAQAPSTFYLGPPITVPEGFTPPQGAPVETVQTFWWPVSSANVVLNPGVDPSTLSLHFTFDNTQWHPICAPGNVGEIAAILPAERLGSAAGYQLGTGDLGHQIRVYNSANLTYEDAGNQIHIDFDGNAPSIAGDWTSWPVMQLGVVGPDVLFYIGFRYGETATLLSLHPQLLANPMIGPTIAALYAWQSGRYPVEQAALADLQQPVDWAVKTAEVEVNGMEFSVRGAFLTAMHFGNGTNDVVPGWLYGPLNTATSTDWRDWSGQNLDFAAPVPGNSLQTDILAYPRMVPTSTPTADPTRAVFGGTPKWGDSADASKGNLLIGDPAVDTLATTDGSKGMRASILVHGTMNSPGECVKLGRIEADIVQTGKRQRWR